MSSKEEPSTPSNLVQLGGSGSATTSAGFEIDPVCKMRVSPETAAARFDYNGRTYYFCARHCMERFAANPAAFLQPLVPPSPPAASDVIYTCPMHPDVRQKGPGACPKCGMALEPEVAAPLLRGLPDGVEVRRVGSQERCQLPLFGTDTAELRPSIDEVEDGVAEHASVTLSAVVA